jgi:hypothetical protein
VQCRYDIFGSFPINNNNAIASILEMRELHPLSDGFLNTCHRYKRSFVLSSFIRLPQTFAVARSIHARIGNAINPLHTSTLR